MSLIYGKGPTGVQVPLAVNGAGEFLANAGTDSTGAALPANFDSLGKSTHTTWDGFFPSVETITVVSGASTYTQTITYTNDGTNITDEVASKWVKSL